MKKGHIRLRCNKLSTEKYDIYRSSSPGSSYSLISTKPPTSHPVFDEFEVPKDITIDNLSATPLDKGIRVSWDSLNGVYETYKIVPYKDGSPAFQPEQDSPWMVDTLPHGAVWVESDGMSWEPMALEGTHSIRVSARGGYSYVYFDGASYSITDRFIIAWVYIEPGNIPDSIMLTFFDGSWSHRVYWGRDLFPFGIEGSKSMRHMGNIPNPGYWSPLIVDKELIGAGDITGMGFGVFKKSNNPHEEGIAYFNAVYTSDQKVYRARNEMLIDRFIVERHGGYSQFYKVVAKTKERSFSDLDAIDIYGYNNLYTPNYTLTPSLDGQSIQITWSLPPGVGTDYRYRVHAVDSYAYSHVASEILTISKADYGYVEIRGGIDSSNLTLLDTVYGNSFTHEGLDIDTTYYYNLRLFSSGGNLLSEVLMSASTSPGSMLDFFILDKSPLA